MAKEVLAAGPQPRTILETIIVTLAHLALHSEKIELEVFTRQVLLELHPRTPTHTKKIEAGFAWQFSCC